MDRLSIIIPNYNYAAYVGLAIESALAIDWPDVEVVVVDDGSTDDSLNVIMRFAHKVIVLATENAGQRVAANRGFAVSTGDVVIFLDSDDLLPPDLARHLAPAWRSTTSKAQFRMQRIDRDGGLIGTPFPRFTPPPTPALIRRWAIETSAYPTPPGSGNAYARWFLAALMPVGAEVGEAADSALLAAAPFLGEVVTVPEVVVSYRRHGANDSTLVHDVRRFAREVDRARARWRYAQRALNLGSTDDRPLFRSRELLQLRVASAVFASDGSPLENDGTFRLTLDSVRSPLHPGPETWRQRVLVAMWCLVTLAAPSALAQKLVLRRYGRLT